MGSGGYRLLIVPGDNRWRLDRFSPTTGQRVLAEGTGSVVRGGNERNRAELTCAGNVITALVNGVQVASVSDDTFRTGRLWVGAGPWSGVAALTEARFDNLVVTRR
jgi:hypothetical protein